MQYQEEAGRPPPQGPQQVGLSPADIEQQAYYALHGGLTNEYFRQPNLRQDTILVRYEQGAHNDLQNLENLYLSTPSGKQILLKSVARIVPTLAPTAIEHDGSRRVVGVTGFYRIGKLPSMDVIMNLVNNVYAGNPNLGITPVNFPPGYGLEARGDMTQMMDSIHRLVRSLGLSLLLMYLVLVVQFRGFLQPLQMIASLPLELAGVFFALWLAHQAFSTVSFLGIIVLTGMDITTAILMIDLIMKYRDKGMARNDAVMRACPDRLRPILMTSCITLIVMLPVALTPKTGLDAYQPLATAVVGGLAVGTTLSLFDIPIIHTLVDDLVSWLHLTFLGRGWEWSPPETDLETETG